MATSANGNWDSELTKAFGEFLADHSPVAFLVRQEMNRGKSCAKAIDFVCGAGSFEKFAKEIWEACRAK